ncbi:MAG: ATP-grasp domain-containing protein [Candidatus Brocadiae bacterium]|nr:ATP-grasp domain-containing protein [Candidatus Brocadiia bacterium]
MSRNSESPPCVAVSGLHLGENAQPGPGVIRSLREGIPGVRIVGLAYDALDSSLFMPGLLDDAFLMPYPSVTPETCLERLLEIRDETGINVLIPCLDVELPVLLRLETRLREAGIALALPAAAALARRSKPRLMDLAADTGVATPATRTLLAVQDLEAAARAYGWPLVVKGPFYEAEVVRGPVEAAAAFHKLSAKWGLPLLAQQFVAGEEFDVIALGDGLGGVHGPVGMRKTLVTRLGKAWAAVTVADEELMETARRVVSALRWRGGCEVEMLRSSTDGRLYLIEFNPRFPAWVYLATAAGCNLPLGLVCLAQNRALPPYPAPRAGVCFVRHAVEAIGDLSDMESLMTLGRMRPRPAAAEEEAHGPARV